MSEQKYIFGYLGNTTNNYPAFLPNKTNWDIYAYGTGSTDGFFNVIGQGTNNGQRVSNRYNMRDLRVRLHFYSGNRTANNQCCSWRVVIYCVKSPQAYSSPLLPFSNSITSNIFNATGPPVINSALNSETFFNPDTLSQIDILFDRRYSVSSGYLVTGDETQYVEKMADIHIPLRGKQCVYKDSGSLWSSVTENAICMAICSTDNNLAFNNGGSAQGMFSGQYMLRYME